MGPKAQQAQSFLAFSKKFGTEKKKRGTAGAESSQNTNAARAERNSRLTVLVRKRPLSNKETNNKEKDVVSCDMLNNEAIVREPKLKVDLTKFIDEHHFRLDRCFDEHSNNEDLYLECVRPLVETAFKPPFNGARCTCFAYGQTGSGKTFTMMGPGQRSCDVDGKRFFLEDGERNEESEEPPKGIFLLAAEDIFQYVSQLQEEVTVIISFYEIYCGKLFDLLNRRQILHARENAKNKV